MMLLLKLTLGPLLVAAATLITRKWGPRIGGLLMGLPLTTGPIFLLLAIDQGPHFAAGAAVGVLFGLVGLAAFAAVYAAASSRAGWIVCLALASAAFFVLAGSARQLGSGVVAAGLAAWVAQALAVSLIKPGPGSARTASPWWDLWVRMAAVAGLTLAVTTAAAQLGPMSSGIVGTYPVAITVVIAFTHAQSGRNAVLTMLRGIVLSWMSFASCFFVVGLSLEALGIAPAIGLGMLAAVAMSAVTLWTDRAVAWNDEGGTVRKL